MAKSPLYDNERSQTEADRANERKGEKDMEERKSNDRTAEREGMEKKVAEDKKDSADERAGMEKRDERMDKDRMDERKGMDKFMEDMKAMHKRHEAERRDHHGNHRESMRQMAARHEKDFKGLMESFAMDDAKGEEVTGTEAAAAADAAMEG